MLFILYQLAVFFPVSVDGDVYPVSADTIVILYRPTGFFRYKLTVLFILYRLHSLVFLVVSADGVVYLAYAGVCFSCINGQ